MRSTALGQGAVEREVFNGPSRTKRSHKSTQANATPVTDGPTHRRVFGAIGAMVCYDMNGHAAVEDRSRRDR
jgi:hypothetical protein